MWPIPGNSRAERLRKATRCGTECALNSVSLAALGDEFNTESYVVEFEVQSAGIPPVFAKVQFVDVLGELSPVQQRGGDWGAESGEIVEQLVQ